jgi:uncharacterized phage protein (TIGR02220 family)
MDLSRGCVLLARSLDESDIFQNEKWLKVFIWCLIQANHKGKFASVKIGKSTTAVWVERGQFIFGRNKAAERLAMKPSTVRNIMEILSNKPFENISIKPEPHYSIVTICDYNFYQDMNNYKGQAEGQPKGDDTIESQTDEGQAKGQAEDNQGTGRGQAEDTTNTPNTPNNEKNVKIKNIVDYLNKKLGTKFKATASKTVSCITARLNEDYTEKDFETVIDKKYNEWIGTESEKYLRPETLFGNKFDGYLNQIGSEKKNSRTPEPNENKIRYPKGHNDAPDI